MKEFRAIYPDMKSFIDSTAVARVNGYLGGYGSCDSIEEEIEGFGLSQRAKGTLTSVVCNRKASMTCPVR
ncbi:MAG TPA: hypothetical protein VMU21_00735 [Thermodesulfovibrionales bacterium]|nr:hypothetical protein [Thermodesulfovibrionales bacterium]